MSKQEIVQMLKSGYEDLDWFAENLQTLERTYNNQFIAFHEKKVLMADASFEHLLASLRKKKIDTSRLLIRYVSRVKSIL